MGQIEKEIDALKQTLNIHTVESGSMKEDIKSLNAQIRQMKLTITKLTDENFNLRCHQSAMKRKGNEHRDTMKRLFGDIETAACSVQTAVGSVQTAMNNADDELGTNVEH